MANIKSLLGNFKELLNAYPEEEREKIFSAARWAEGLHYNQKRASGEPFIIHPLSVAEILIDNP